MWISDNSRYISWHDDEFVSLHDFVADVSRLLFEHEGCRVSEVEYLLFQEKQLFETALFPRNVSWPLDHGFGLEWVFQNR